MSKCFISYLVNPSYLPDLWQTVSLEEEACCSLVDLANWSVPGKSCPHGAHWAILTREHRCGWWICSPGQWGPEGWEKILLAYCPSCCIYYMTSFSWCLASGILPWAFSKKPSGRTLEHVTQRETWEASHPSPTLAVSNTFGGVSSGDF